MGWVAAALIALLPIRYIYGHRHSAYIPDHAGFVVVSKDGSRIQVSKMFNNEHGMWSCYDKKSTTEPRPEWPFSFKTINGEAILPSGGNMCLYGFKGNDVGIDFNPCTIDYNHLAYGQLDGDIFQGVLVRHTFGGYEYIGEIKMRVPLPPGSGPLPDQNDLRPAEADDSAD